MKYLMTITIVTIMVLMGMTFDQMFNQPVSLQRTIAMALSK